MIQIQYILLFCLFLIPAGTAWSQTKGDHERCHNYYEQLKKSSLKMESRSRHSVEATARPRQAFAAAVQPNGKSSIRKKCKEFDNSAISIRLRSRAQMVLTTGDGNHLGYDPVSGTEYREIPGGTYSKNGLLNNPGQTAESKDSVYLREIEIMKPSNGKYKLAVIGADTSAYTLSLLTVGSDFQHVTQTSEGVLADPGEVHTYRFLYSKKVGGQITLKRSDTSEKQQSAKKDRSQSPDKPCRYYHKQLKELPHEKLDLHEGMVKSWGNGKENAGCEVTFVTNDSLRTEAPALPRFTRGPDPALEEKGWQYNLMYDADGPGSRIYGIEKGNTLCLVRYAQPATLVAPGEIVQESTLTIAVQCLEKESP